MEKTVKVTPWKRSEVTTRVDASKSTKVVVEIGVFAYEIYPVLKQREKLYVISEWLSNEVVDGTSSDTLISELSEKVGSLSSGKSAKDEISFDEAIHMATGEAEHRYQLHQSGKTVGITTGLRDFDEYLRGWQPGSLNIVAGRPGSGKSSCALHFALSAAQAGSAGVIFSLEMSTVELVGKMIVPHAKGVSYDNYLRGNLTTEDFRGLSQAEAELHTLPLTFIDRSNVSARSVETIVRKLKRQGKCEWVIIDYLQQMRTEKARNKSREQEIAEATRAMKVLAMELKIPVILLAQLNRNVESRADRIPQLSDLRESGSIEQDADVV
jgi:replicative DNA helicase